MKPEIIGKKQTRRGRHLSVKFQITMGLGFQLRAMRKARGWTQAELAGRLGTARSVVSRLEQANDYVPSLTTLLRIGEVFDVALIASFVPFRDWRTLTKDKSTAKLEAATTRKRG